MKKIVITTVCIIGVFGIIWSASQQVISIIADVGSAIPPRMVNQEGYVRHLQGTIETIDKWHPSAAKQRTEDQVKIDWLLQRYMEEAEFKVRYVDVFQRILKKLAKVQIVEES